MWSMNSRSVLSVGLCVWTVSVCIVHVIRAECPHEPSGKTLRRWSDASSWPSGVKPEAGAAVEISDDVLLDESPPDLASVSVNAGGSLVFSPAGDFTLTTNYLMLYGALHIGSEDCRFTANAKIVLTGTRGQYNIAGYGEKFVGVARGATLELHGQNKLSWAKLTSTVNKADYESGILYRSSDDPEVASNVRGLVASVTNGTTGETKFRRTAILIGSNSNRVENDWLDLIEALSGAEDGDVVVLAVQWNAIGDQVHMEPVYDAIERAAYGDVTGTSKARQLREYDAWALVAVRGQFVKEELAASFNSYGRKEARVTAMLPSMGAVVSVVSNTRPSRYQGGYTDVVATTMEAGAQVLDLSHDATTWVPGDKLLLTSTDYDWKQAEEAEVVYCSPDECTNNQVKALLVNKYMHYGEITQGVDERAEVALLSRNIVIEGRVENDCPEVNDNCDLYSQDTFGGHITIQEGFENVHVEGVALQHMGQIMEHDRHPLFFHQCGDVDAEGSYTNPAYVRSISITDSYSKCVVLSGTHGLTIQDNVAYNHYGSCYFLKDGGEKRTVIDGNLGAGTKIIQEYIPLDKQASTFLITNPLTYFRNNVAAGGEKRGINYLFPVEPVGESAGKGIMQPEEARRTAFLEFNNNVVHSYHYMGLTISDKMNEAGDNYDGWNNHDPKVNPLEKDSENTAIVLRRLHAFKNRETNAYVRGGGFVIEDSSFADSALSLMFARPASHRQQFLENSIVVGESDNIGEPTRWWDGDNRIHVPLSRSIPVYWDIRRPVKGFSSYDGPFYLTNVWFQNFIPNDNRTASALGFPGNNHWTSSSVNEVKGLSFGFKDGLSTGLRMYDGNSSEYRFGDRDGDMAVTMRDSDGSLTGAAGSTVLRNYPVFTTDQCYRRHDWNLAICPHKYGKLSVSANAAKEGRSRPILTRDDVAPDLGQELPFQYLAEFPVILGGSHSYVLHWSRFLPSPVHFSGDGFEKDYGLRFGMCVPRDAELNLYTYRPDFRPNIGRFKEVSSVDHLDRDSEGGRYFWDRTNGVIFFKLVNHRTRCPDFKDECKDGCPYLRVELLSGNSSDSDCRDRISAYTRQPISGTGGLTHRRLQATEQQPDDVGAGEVVPFETRPSVDGGYGDWTSWGPCTTTCGGGTQIRSRPCDSPMPQKDGRQCVGPRQEVQVCGTTPCEIDGDLSTWTVWSTCEALPDNGQKGKQTRVRNCSDPAPLYNGVACTGSTAQMQGCTVTA